MRRGGWRMPWMIVMVSSVVVVVMLGLGFGLTASASVQPADKPFTFTLAVVRRDGLMFPFAAYDGKHFSNNWPEPEKTVNAPISLSDIPKHWWFDYQPIKDWTFFPISSDGGPQRTIHVTGTTWFPDYCLQSIGLSTDYKPTVVPPPPRVQPYPKDGLAVSGNIVISPIMVIRNPNDQIALTLKSKLPDVVNPKETAVVKEYLHESWMHSYDEQERKAQPITLEALYRVPHGVAGKDVYYFEAVKRYFLPKPGEETSATQDSSWIPGKSETVRTSPEPKCDLVTFASGWFTSDETGTQISTLTPQVRVTSCDYKGAAFMLPLGTVTIDQKHLWITQWSNWNAADYTIVEPSESGEVKRVFESPGGRCEK